MNPKNEGVGDVFPAVEVASQQLSPLGAAQHRLDVIASAGHEVSPDPVQVDRAVAGYVSAANDTGDVEIQVDGAEVGALEVLHDVDAQKTPIELGATPVGALGTVLREVDKTLGPEATGTVIEAIESAGHDSPQTNNILTPSPNGTTIYDAEVFPTPVKRARAFLERVNPDASEALVTQLAERIADDDEKRAGRPLFVSNQHIQSRLASCEGDSEAVVDAVASFMRSDEYGREQVTSLTSAWLMAVSLPQEHLQDIFAKYPTECEKLATVISTSRITLENKVSIRAHITALKIAEILTGSNPLEWRERIRSGERLPDLADNYVEKPYLAYTVFRSAAEPYLNQSEKDMPPAEKVAFDEHMLTVAREALNYVMDVDRSPGHRDLLDQFRTGDIRQYGFTVNQGPNGNKLTPNDHFYGVVARYLLNVDALGHEGLKILHERLGTVNFGSLSTATFIAMKDILTRTVKPESINVVVRGKNGDHNGAFSKDLLGVNPRETLVFEIGHGDDLEGVNATLDSLGTPVRSLALVGHGNKKGMRISNNFALLRDFTALKLPSIRRLLFRVAPDTEGRKPVTLISCSQGRRYRDATSPLKGKSMAELINGSVPQTIVTAAPDVSEHYATGRPGELRTVSNRFYNLAEHLQARYPLHPGTQKAVQWLLDEKRWRRGVVVVHKGKTTKDSSGIVRIGA